MRKNTYWNGMECYTHDSIPNFMNCNLRQHHGIKSVNLYTICVKLYQSKHTIYCKKKLSAIKYKNMNQFFSRQRKYNKSINYGPSSSRYYSIVLATYFVAFEINTEKKHNTNTIHEYTHKRRSCFFCG